MSTRPSKDIANTYEKKEWINAHEQRLANFVAGKVIDKPELSIWMILIPVIFVWFFFQLKKVSDGRKEFSFNFMITRRRALDAAYVGLESGDSPDPDQLCRMSSSPAATYGAYAEWLEILLRHYKDLMNADGDSMEELIRSVYRTRANYLLFLHQLQRAEKQFNAALAPHLGDSIKEVEAIVKAMESQSEAYRRKEAEEIFPGMG